jgi:D-alanyl-D-alanine carboxypeptidase
LSKAIKLLFYLVVANLLILHSWAIKPDANIVSEAYIVMDARSGQVLYEHNAKLPMFPASITKILTCALALENCDPSETATLSHNAVFSVPRDTTHIALTEGEVISVNDLLGAAMVESANDACNGLAEHVSKTQEAFIKLMNDRAKQVGAGFSNFKNPSGLHDPAHVTTAYDMAMITRWALGVEGFRNYFGAEEWEIKPTNKQKDSRKFGTHHHMLVTSKFYYQGTTGGKLGWTPEAKHTLVTVAKRGGIELICVVLKSENQYDKYRDSIALFDEAFSKYKSVSYSQAYFQFEPIPIYSGETQVGEAEILPEEITFLRPATLAKADIIIKPSIAKRRSQNDTDSVSVDFFGPDGRLLYQTDLRIVDHIRDDDESAPVLALMSPQFGQNNLSLYNGLAPWHCFLLAFVFLSVAVLFSIRAKNLSKKNRRRKEAQRRSALLKK